MIAFVSMCILAASKKRTQDEQVNDYRIFVQKSLIEFNVNTMFPEPGASACALRFDSNGSDDSIDTVSLLIYVCHVGER